MLELPVGNSTFPILQTVTSAAAKWNLSVVVRPHWTAKWNLLVVEADLSGALLRRAYRHPDRIRVLDGLYVALTSWTAPS